MHSARFDQSVVKRTHFRDGARTISWTGAIRSDLSPKRERAVAILRRTLRVTKEEIIFVSICV